MKIPHFTLAVCGLAGVLFSGVAVAEEPENDPLPVIEPLRDPEPSIAVMPTEVSLDGIDHPALGRSLSDSLMGGLLAQGGAKVISYEEGKKEEVVPPLRPETPEEVLAGMLGRKMGAQRILVPRLVGEDEFYRFTVKEVDTGNYEVIRVFELSHVGDREGIFGFVPLVLSELEKDGEAKEAREKPKGNPVIKIWSWEEFERDFGKDGGVQERQEPPRVTPVERPEVVRVEEEEKRAISPDEKEARVAGRQVAEMVALGKIASVNDQWGFCVIDMTGRKLKAAEELEIRAGESNGVYATLVVKRVEGGKAIADLAEGQTGKRILPGDVVFGWEIR